MQYVLVSFAENPRKLEENVNKFFFCMIGEELQNVSKNITGEYIIRRNKVVEYFAFQQRRNAF